VLNECNAEVHHMETATAINRERDRGARTAFYRTIMRLGLRYTIYEGDVVVIERPQGPAIVVDLSTGRIENA
jgi:hypothetical protein